MRDREGGDDPKDLEADLSRAGRTDDLADTIDYGRAVAIAERVIETAVKGMLPKNPLGRAMYLKLKVYAGPNHPHTAQQPQPLDI